MDAVEEAFQHIAREKEKGADVRLVSFRQFVDWMDVQKPEVLAKLRTLGVGQQPTGGWKGVPAGHEVRLLQRGLMSGMSRVNTP